MSPRLLSLVLVFVVGLAALFVLQRRDTGPTEVAVARSAPKPEAEPEIAPGPVPREASATSAREIPAGGGLVASAQVAASGAGAAKPLAPADRLEAAILTYDASALPVIAPFLVHEDPELREAAREGLLQMGLGEAVPLLREAAAKMKDPREAVALLDAAEFLELPPGTIGGGRPRPSTNIPAEQRHRRPSAASAPAR
jgi:hypothetical protein